MIELPIANGFYEDDSKPISAQECINFIPQVPQTTGLSQAQLIGTPGISQFATAGSNASRGRHVMDEIAYSVNGTTLYRINSDGTTTSLGTIVGSGTVSMADNGLQLMIVVPGSTAYVYTASTGVLAAVTDTDFTTTLGPSDQVIHSDGYFIHFNNSSAAASGRPIFFKSALNDGLSYDALDFGTAEADPDAITGIHEFNNNVYVGGGKTMEPFRNVGGTGFPYQRIPGAIIQKGIKARFTLVDFDNTFVFLGGGENEKPSIWKMVGNSPVKIATQAIESIIQDSTDAEQKEIFATTYSDKTGTFVAFHFKNRVMVYDAQASALSGSPKWHERKSKDSLGRSVLWRVNGIINAYGQTLVTDNQDGRIGQIENETYTEYGDSMTSIAATMPFSAQGRDVFFSEMELTCESGVGNITSPGDEPLVSREFSDDGGFTFDNQTFRSLGKIGDYKRRQIWRREGHAERYRVYRFTMADPVKKVIIKLEANIQA